MIAAGVIHLACISGSTGVLQAAWLPSEPRWRRLNEWNAAYLTKYMLPHSPHVIGRSEDATSLPYLNPFELPQRS